MSLKFSQRIGLVPVETPLQTEDISEELRSTLWNIFYNGFYIHYDKGNYQDQENYYSALKIIWFRFLKKPIDEVDHMQPTMIKHEFKGIFLRSQWHTVYEFYEYLVKENFGKTSIDRDQFQETLNFHLEENHSGYRMIEYVFIPLTNSNEIEEVQNLNANTVESKLQVVNKHLKSAIALLSDRTSPDYRNSIKESISIIESVARLIYPDSNSLGKALKKLKDENILDSTLVSGFEKIYGYTNGKDGIRHAILESATKIEREDAQYFLVSCSAFANYLIEKARKNEIL